MKIMEHIKTFFSPLSIFFIFISLGTGCINDNSIMNITDNQITLDTDSNSFQSYIKSFDSYSNEDRINLYWTTGYPYYDPRFHIGDSSINFSKVSVVRLFLSSTSPDEEFIQIYQSSQTGKDSTSISNLSKNTVYYFRIATYDSTGQVTDVSGPLMTTINRQPDEYFTVPLSEKENPNYFGNLTWSPEGDKIALVKMDNVYHPNIYALDLNSFSMQKITNFATENYRLMSISFSPGGDQIAYCYSPSQTYGELDYRIWTVNLSNLLKKTVTSGRVDSNPAWLSDNSIVFCKGTHGPPNIPELYIVDLQTGAETEITNDQQIYKYSPSFSASKRLIVYSGEFSNKRYLFSISPGGENNTPLTPNDYWRDLHPSWSADGNKIYFTSNRCGHYEIWSFDITTENYIQITHGVEKGINRFYGRPDPNERYIAIVEYNEDYYYVLKLLYLHLPMNVS